MNRTLFVLLLIVTAALAALITTVAMTSAESGSDPRDSMAALLAELAAQDQTVMLEFAAPLSGQEKSRSVEASSLQLGADYLCLSEPWNQGVRQTCTPLSNIASVTFTED